MKKVLIICFLSFFFIFNSVYSYITPTLSNTNNCFEPVIGNYASEGDTQSNNDLGRLSDNLLGGIFASGGCGSDFHFYADYGVCLSVKKPDGKTISVFFENGTNAHRDNTIINVINSTNLYKELVDIYNYNTSFFDLSGEYEIRSSYIKKFKEEDTKKICETKFLGRRVDVAFSRGYHPDFESVFATMNIRNLQDVLNRVYIPNDWDTNSTIIYCNGMNDGISLEPSEFRVLSSLSDLYKGCLIKNLDKDENNTIMMGFKKTTYYDISEVDLDNDFSNLLNSLGLEASDLENLKDTRIIKNTFDDDDLKILFNQTLEEYIEFYNSSNNEILDFQYNVSQLDTILSGSHIVNITEPYGTPYNNFYKYQYTNISNSFGVLRLEIDRVLQRLLSLENVALYEDKLIELNLIEDIDLELYDKIYSDYNDFILDTSNNEVNNFDEYNNLYYVAFEEEYAKYQNDDFNHNDAIGNPYLKLEEALIAFKRSMKTYNSSGSLISNYVSIPSNYQISNSDTKSDYSSVESDIKSYVRQNKNTGDNITFTSQTNNLKINYKPNIDRVYLEVKNLLDILDDPTSTQSQVDSSLNNIQSSISSFNRINISSDLNNSLNNLSTIIENSYFSLPNIEMLKKIEEEKDLTLASFKEDILKIEDFVEMFDTPSYHECNENYEGVEDVNNCFYKVEKVYSNDRYELSNIPLIFKFNNFIQKNETMFRKIIYDNVLTNNMVDLNKNVLMSNDAFRDINGNWKTPNNCNSISKNYTLKAKQDCISYRNFRNSPYHKKPSIKEGDFLQTTSINGINFDTYNILKKYPINYYKKDFEIDEINYSFEYDDVSTFFILKNFNNVDLFQKNENNKLLRDNIANKIDLLEEAKMAYISINTPNTNLNLDLKEEVSYTDPTEKVNIEIDRNNLFSSTDCNILTREDENIANCGSANIYYENSEDDFQNFFFNFMDVISNIFAKD